MSWLSLPWGRMRFEDSGGPEEPCVFLHGTGCDADDWAGVVGSLPRSMRIVLMDFRGHGRSDAPAQDFTIDDLASDVLSLVDHLGLPKATLVGHSLGGMVALCAAAASSRIERLVLLEGWTRLRSAGAFAGDRLYGQLSRERIVEIREKAARTTARIDPAVWERFWDSVKAFDGARWLRASRIPVVEVYGELGKTADTNRVLGVPQKGNIRFVWLPGAGHYLPHEAPGAVAGIVGSLRVFGSNLA